MVAPLLNLNLMGDGKRDVKESDIRAVPLPAKTDSYTPLGHMDLIERIRGGLETSGLEILQEKHMLARNGQRLFSMVQVDNGSEDTQNGLIVGIRNSYDKSFPAAICAGRAPTVCSNLLFSGEIKVQRRHTKYIFRDLGGLIARGIGKLADMWTQQVEREEVYKNIDLACMQEVDHLIMEAGAREVVPKSKLFDVRGQWIDPEHSEFKDRNLYSLYNAFTNILRGQSLIALPERTVTLNGFFDARAGILNQETVPESVHSREALVNSL